MVRNALFTLVYLMLYYLSHVQCFVYLFFFFIINKRIIVIIIITWKCDYDYAPSIINHNWLRL